MQWFENAFQPIRFSRNSYKMDMICHQTPCQNQHFVANSIALKPFQIDLRFCVLEEHFFPAISTLHYVMRDSGKNGSHEPWHSLQVNLRFQKKDYGTI